MTKVKYFTYIELADSVNGSRCVICPASYDNFPFSTEKSGGSYHVAPARVLGLDYPTYLRFLRDAFGDEVKLEGRNSLYVTPIWRKGKTMYTFIDLLNNKLNLAVTQNDEN